MRLLKCVVDDIVVDVAQPIRRFSYVGLSEEVNAKIGKNDLFRRSVILIKATLSIAILGARALLSVALKTLIICALRRNATDDDDDDDEQGRKKNQSRHR